MVCHSTTPQGKRTPELFKVEYTGTKMVSLCSKSYCIEDTDNGTVKFSMKVVNKNQFDNPMTHYQETLETAATFRATNSGIRKKGLDMTTYSLTKDALTYFYQKRKSWRMDIPQSHWISKGEQYIFPVTKELEYKNIFIISL